MQLSVHLQMQQNSKFKINALADFLIIFNYLVIVLKVGLILVLNMVAFSLLLLQKLKD